MARRLVVFLMALACAGMLGTGPASASSGWQITATPVNPYGTQVGAYMSLASVSCISAGACTAVGSVAPASSNGAHGGYGPSYALIERWNGTAWKIQSYSKPTGYPAELNGVKCISSSFCMAVGRYNTSTGKVVTLAMKWNGTAWKILPVPNPAGSIGGDLYGIACTTTANCIAVGSSYTSSTTVALAERWNGTSWSPMSLGAPSASILYSVSCTAASACSAVGTYTVAVGNIQALAERWNGKTWAIQTVAVPTGAQRTELNGVKCISATACIAVGDSLNSDNSLPLLAEYWNGSSWTIQPSSGSGVFHKYHAHQQPAVMQSDNLIVE
jgi:hypothetical protein